MRINRMPHSGGHETGMCRFVQETTWRKSFSAVNGGLKVETFTFVRFFCFEIVGMRTTMYCLC